MTSLHSCVTPQPIVLPNQISPHDLSSISCIQPIFLFNTTTETNNDCCLLQSTQIAANLSQIAPLASTSLESKPSTLSTSSSSAPTLIDKSFHDSKTIYSNLIRLMSQQSNIKSVCISSYTAMFVEDLTVNAGDAVHVLKDNNDDWLLVQLVESNDRQGYVPRDIVVNIHLYLSFLNQQISKSKSSTISLPISV